MKGFLGEELKLKLSEEKTLITHTRSEAAKFLGYEIPIIQENHKRTKRTRGQGEETKCRSINGRVGLRLPRTVLLDKCHRYMRQGKVRHRPELLNESDSTIVMTYQLEYRGLANYYLLAYNLHSLHLLKWVMEQSLTKTLAHKHKTSVTKIYEKYRADISVDGRIYKGLQVTVPRENKLPLIATWGGVPLRWKREAIIEDRPQRQWNRRSELEKRLLAQVCEIGEATTLTEKIEVHHIRALKDFNRYEGREKPLWVQVMAARRRKTLVLCHTCHTDLHAGRPLKRSVSRSRTG